MGCQGQGRLPGRGDILLIHLYLFSQSLLRARHGVRHGGQSCEDVISSVSFLETYSVCVCTRVCVCVCVCERERERERERDRKRARNRIIK